MVLVIGQNIMKNECSASKLTAIECHVLYRIRNILVRCISRVSINKSNPDHYPRDPGDIKIKTF